jgi:8-oxo-dGTP diphosphatase
LVFLARGEDVLLIRKKRGLGAGKINAPGGRLEPGESPLACALREVEEELCVVPEAPVHCGENYFQFVDSYSIHVHVYLARGFSGEPQETAEAAPLWFPADQLPYEEMWEDDTLWVPHVFSGRRFVGRYIFDGERMLDHQIELG